MQLPEFFGRVLPATGDTFFSATVDHTNNNKFSEQHFANVVALEHFIEQSKQHQQPFDLYFATGSFGTSRKQAQYKKAFYVDLDCGVGKGYATKTEAITDLKRFCVDTKLMLPSIIVDSGNGVHCYWTLTEAMPGTQWRLLAFSFKKLCSEHKLRADPTSTADVARILRVPTSTNYKDPTNPKVTRILRGDGTRDYTLDEFTAAIGALPSKLTGKLGQWAEEDDLTGGLNWSRGPRYLADLIVQKCEIFKESIRTGGEGQLEPLWQHQLQVLAFTQGGDKYVHPISEKHADYDAKTTDYKYELEKNKVGTSIGPITCVEFETYAPEMCARCAYHTAVKSPILLGEPTNQNVAPSGYTLEENSVTHEALITLKDGTTTKKIVNVCNFGIKDFNVTRVPPIGELTAKFLAVCFGVPKEVSLSLSLVHDKKQLILALSSQGVAIHDHQCKGFRDFMTTWIEQMQRVRKDITAYAHMGWVGDNARRGFALGDKVIWPNGGDTMNSLDDYSFAEHYTAVGDPQPWVDVATEITRQQRPEINALIATAFAAPLLQLMGQDGFFISFTSSESGSGKTMAMRTAQAIWGDWKRGISALDDTPMSIVKKLGFLHNLPAYWDEVRIKDDPKGFVKFMIQLSLGKERSRLTTAAKLQDMGTWSTIMVIATNDALVDHVKKETEGTDAGRARIFEVTVPPLKAPDYKLQDRVNNLAANYGHAGLVYARHLVEHREQIKSLLESTTASLVRKLNPTSAERFWVAGASAIYVGAKLSIQLGLTKIDEHALLHWLVAQVQTQRRSMKDAFKPVQQTALDYVWEYCAEFREQMFVCDHLTQRGVSSPGTIHSYVQRGRILGTLAKKDSMVRICKMYFIDWLYEKHITPTHVIDAIIKQKLGHEKKAVLAGGYPNTVQDRVNCLEIQLPVHDLLSDD